MWLESKCHKLCEKPQWWKLDPEGSANQDEVLGFRSVGKELKARKAVPSCASELTPVAGETADLKPEAGADLGARVQQRDSGKGGQAGCAGCSAVATAVGRRRRSQVLPWGDGGVDGWVLAPSVDSEKNSWDGGTRVTIRSHLWVVRCRVQLQRAVRAGEAGGEEADSVRRPSTWERPQRVTKQRRKTGKKPWVEKGEIRMTWVRGGTAKAERRNCQ